MTISLFFNKLHFNIYCHMFDKSIQSLAYPFKNGIIVLLRPSRQMDGHFAMASVKHTNKQCFFGGECLLPLSRLQGKSYHRPSGLAKTNSSSNAC